MDRAEGYQGPTNGQTAQAYADLWSIVTHPAFRIGFLDAKTGRAFDHDAIRARLAGETPERAWERMGFTPPAMLTPDEIALAQVRYEEGRLYWLTEKPKVRAWGHPDYPPAAVQDYLRDRCKDDLAAAAAEARARIDAIPSIVDHMRGRAVPQRCSETLPLFAEARP